jgi:hypothetical protein
MQHPVIATSLQPRAGCWLLSFPWTSQQVVGEITVQLRAEGKTYAFMGFKWMQVNL